VNELRECRCVVSRDGVHVRYDDADGFIVMFIDGLSQLFGARRGRERVPVAVCDLRDKFRDDATAA